MLYYVDHWAKLLLRCDPSSDGKDEANIDIYLNCSSFTELDNYPNKWKLVERDKTKDKYSYIRVIPYSPLYIKNTISTEVYLLKPGVSYGFPHIKHFIEHLVL